MFNYYFAKLPLLTGISLRILIIMVKESKVYFFYEKKGFRLDNRQRLKSFIERLFKKEKKRLASINYVFCSDKRVLEINRTYLKHDYLTDIITFDLSEGPETTAEVYISIDRVKENALHNKVSFKNELHRVVFHGALHLCGYIDKKREDIAKMRLKEDQYLALYGL
jgi:probable rRNA maturation factor